MCFTASVTPNPEKDFLSNGFHPRQAVAEPTFTPPAASAWANTGWAGDKRFIGCWARLVDLIDEAPQRPRCDPHAK
jgi:hypothetical protein